MPVEAGGHPKRLVQALSGHAEIGWKQKGNPQGTKQKNAVELRRETTDVTVREKYLLYYVTLKIEPLKGPHEL